MPTMQSIADIFSAGFGHPVDRLGARSDGLLRSAQTEGALAQARERRANAVLHEKTAAQRDAILQDPSLLGGDPNVTLANVMAAGYGNYDQATQGLGNRQQQGFRDTIASPTAANPDRYRAMEAASLKPVDNYYDPAPGMLANRNDATAPTVTPIGQAQIDNYHELSGGGGSGGLSGDTSPENVESLAQMVAQGRAPLPTGRAALSPLGMAVINRAAQINSGMAGQTYPTRLATLNDFNKGQSGQRLRAVNTALDHLETMDGLADATKNGDVQLFNRLSNAIGTQLGATAPTNLAAASQLVGNEIIKAIINTGAGTGAERAEAAAAFASARTPEQMHQAAQTYRYLLGGQARSLKQQYQVGTGLDNFDERLTPASLRAIATVPPGHTTPAAGTGKAPNVSPLRNPSAPAPAAPASVAPSAPKEGDIVDGYQFAGGDPAVQSNWYPVAR
jgi:hypothetical protein